MLYFSGGDGRMRTDDFPNHAKRFEDGPEYVIG